MTHEKTNEIKERLRALGLKDDVIPVVIELSVRIEILNSIDDNLGRGAYLTYDWFDHQFSNSTQNWSCVKDLVRDSIWICDYHKSFGNSLKEKDKAYCYHLTDQHREQILNFMLDEYYNNSRRNKKKWNQKFKDIRRAIRKKLKVGFPTRHEKDYGRYKEEDIGENGLGAIITRKFHPPVQPGDFLLHNVDVLKRIELTEETRRRLDSLIQRVRSLSDCALRDALVSKLICDLANIKKLREGIIKLEFSTDGRWHQNGYVGLSKELRETLTVNGHSLQAVLDIRSCHWAFLGFYLRSINPKLEDEVTRWNTIFLDPEIKPRELIKKGLANMGCGIPLEDSVTETGAVKAGLKTIMNSFLNGAGRGSNGELKKGGANYRAFQGLDNWFRSNFPEMYSTWRGTDLRSTGTMISKNWEAPIMQHPDVFKKAKELGVYLANEHDGVGFFAANRDHVQEVLKTFQTVAKEHFGVNLVMVDKAITKRGDEWFITDEEIKIRRARIVNTLKDRIAGLNQRIKGSANGREFVKMRELQRERNDLLEKWKTERNQLIDDFGVDNAKAA